MFRSAEHAFGLHTNDDAMVASEFTGAESDVFNFQAILSPAGPLDILPAAFSWVSHVPQPAQEK